MGRLDSILKELRIRPVRQLVRSPSIWALVAANVMPLAGILFLGWDVRLVLFVYWAENVVVGFYNVLRIALHRPDDAKAAGPGRAVMAVFFTVHFGLFCLGHGVFLAAFAGLDEAAAQIASAADGLAWFWNSGFAWAVIALMLSHGVSFVHHYIIGGERRTATVEQLMLRPYGRIVLLHVTLIVGAIPVIVLGLAGLVVMLVLLKTGLDIWLHEYSHRPRRRPDESFVATQ